MELEINHNQPTIMHIDLNSCFAILEQQANPLIRHKPVAIVPYNSPRSIIIAASYEAKALGIKVGTTIQEAKILCPKIITLTPDPDKYFDAHQRFKQILLQYTNDLTPKSIDEFVIDFNKTRQLIDIAKLSEIGQQIKKDIKLQLGEYVTVNIGISTNRFLAKLAAGLHKPDGLDIIDHHNLISTYQHLDLLDLPGINSHYKARLNLAQIFNPLDFLNTSATKLRKEVFKGINGYYWYLRLRGHEIDSVVFDRRSFGQQYALGKKTTDRQELLRLYMKLAEKAGRRLRHNGYASQGIQLWLNYNDHSYWTERRKLRHTIYSTQDIYYHCQQLLAQTTIQKPVSQLGITLYALSGCQPHQLNLFNDARLDNRHLAKMADKINDRYGEFTLIPALMANMDNIIIKRVAFGSVNDD